MEISKYLNGIRVSTGDTSVYINPSSEIDNGVVIYTNSNPQGDTNNARLIIEGPGEYEYQGIYIKGVRKADTLSFTISYNERKIYFTDSDGISSIPEDEMFDAVIIDIKSGLDASKISKTSYPTIYLDNGKALLGKIDAEEVKNVNLKKITPEEKNIYILQ